MADAKFSEPEEILPPLARGLRDWSAAFKPAEERMMGVDLVDFWAHQFQTQAPPTREPTNLVRSWEVVAAYRLTRMVAIFRMLIAQEGALDEISEHPIYGCPWTRWWTPEGLPMLSMFYDVRSAAEACRVPPGVPLEPPHDPDELEHWIDAMWRCSELLNMREHEKGCLGSRRLLSPKTLFHAWPDRGDLLAFEQVLFQTTFDMVISDGPSGAGRSLELEYGFEPREARGIVRAARERAQLTNTLDLDEERVLLLRRLEEHYRRAKQAMDLKAERNALKDIANILGLTRSTPDDVLVELTRTLRAVNESRPAAQIAHAEVVELDIPAAFRRPKPLEEHVSGQE